MRRDGHETHFKKTSSKFRLHKRTLPAVPHVMRPDRRTHTDPRTAKVLVGNMDVGPNSPNAAFAVPGEKTMSHVVKGAFRHVIDPNNQYHDINGISPSGSLLVSGYHGGDVT